MMQMKLRLYGLFILLGIFLLVPSCGTAKASNSMSPRKIFISTKNDVVHIFMGVENTTKKTTRIVGHGTVHTMRKVKSGTKQTARAVGHGFAHGAHEVGTQTKKTARAMKHDIVQVFRGGKDR
jgi:hypothetical protein